MKNIPLQKAIDFMGGQTALGAAIGRRQSTVRSWLIRGEEVPADIAVNIHIATDGHVSKEELCPSFPWSKITQLERKHGSVTKNSKRIKSN